jgi:HlyD family secretion protein
MSEEAKEKHIDDVGDDISAQLQEIEIRSEEVQEIMGFIPHWIIRWGITLIFLVIFFVLLGSWFFRYPDVIVSEIVLTTENPPAPLIARVNGKIAELFVNDNQKVKKGKYLAVIENATDHKDLLELKKKLRDSETYFTFFESSPPLSPFNRNYSLGELQPSYASFLKSDADYRNFLLLNLHQKKIDSINRQVQQHRLIMGQLQRQITIRQKEFDLSSKQYKRAVDLRKEKILSERDYEAAETTYLQSTFALESAKNSLTSSQLQIAQLEQSVLDLQLQATNEKTRLQLTLKQDYENLVARIDQWEQNYMLKAPIDGVVSFNAYWSINQNVKSGDRVMTIIPDNAGKIFGRVILPLEGAGKVKEDQMVNIKLINYPHMDFGMLTGKVKSKSAVATDNFYILEVELMNGLKTSYGKELEFSQEMKGIAEIITEDVTLFERILKPLKSVMDKM